SHYSDFNAKFCVRRVEILTSYDDYYRQVKRQRQPYMKIPTIFSYQTNGDMQEGFDMDYQDFVYVAEPAVTYTGFHIRGKLENHIVQYNADHSTSYSTKDSESFYNYYKAISNRVRKKQIDLLFVVNMFLTGFDSKTLNTLYVDKNLRYHGLIQAYSRTNRILDTQKSKGNIVCFRNLKNATDEAITLFSNPNAIEEIILQPYEDYVQKFIDAFDALIAITPTVDSVNTLQNEEEQAEFIKTFREVMRLLNKMKQYGDFNYND